MTVTEENMHHDEVPNAARLLARAFAADPVITYFLNAPLRRRFAFPAFFRAIIREHVEGGHVYSGFKEGVLLGVAVWATPEGIASIARKRFAPEYQP